MKSGPQLREAAFYCSSSAQVQARFAQFSTIAPAPNERTPEYLTALIAREGQRWGELLRAAGVQKEG